MRRPPVLMTLLLALVPAAAGAATPAKPVKPVKTPGILYALDAKGAVITPSGGSMRLSMPADTIVMWFTDRPARRAGSVRLSELYGVWKASGFVKDPPNAALQTMTPGPLQHPPPLRHGPRLLPAATPVPRVLEAALRRRHRAGGYRARVGRGRGASRKVVLPAPRGVRQAPLPIRARTRVAPKSARSSSASPSLA